MKVQAPVTNVIWKGQEANVEEAQELSYNRAKLDFAARQAQYYAAMEVQEHIIDLSRN